MNGLVRGRGSASGVCLTCFLGISMSGGLELKSRELFIQNTFTTSHQCGSSICPMLTQSGNLPRPYISASCEAYNINPSAAQVEALARHRVVAASEIDHGRNSSR